MKNLLICVAIFCSISFIYAAENCLQISSSDQSSEKSVNLVFVPSNFNGDVSKFTEEAKNMFIFMQTYTPFNSKIKNINVYISKKESSKNNFCKYNCQGIPRLLCCSTRKARKLSKKCTKAIKRQTIVIHNDSVYGGAGYRGQNVATTSMHPESRKVTVHELGHSLFKLIDEYIIKSATPKHPNCDNEGCNKWKDLIDIGMEDVDCVPNKCAKGKYYASGNTLMYSLNGKFLPSNERITCCTYKNLLGPLPEYCNRFNQNGLDLNEYCAKTTLHKSITNIYRPIEFEFDLASNGKWEVANISQEKVAQTFSTELINGDGEGKIKVEVILNSNAKTFYYKDIQKIEYMDYFSSEGNSKYVDHKRTLIRLILDGSQINIEKAKSFVIKINGAIVFK